MADITYELEDLREAKNSIKNLINALDNDCKRLDSELLDLQSAWVTDAGRKFFDAHKNTWTTYVNKYVKKLSGIEHMLEKTISEYEQMENEVKKLNV